MRRTVEEPFRSQSPGRHTELGQPFGPIAAGGKRLDRGGHGGGGLEAVAALAGKPEEARSGGREAGGRHPVGDERSKPRPAMGDAGNREGGELLELVRGEGEVVL